MLNHKRLEIWLGLQKYLPYYEEITALALIPGLAVKQLTCDRKVQGSTPARVEKLVFCDYRLLDGCSGITSIVAGSRDRVNGIPGS